MQASKRFIQDLHVFMSNYTACDLEIFVKTIDGIAEEAAKYQEQAALVAELHNHLYTDSHALVDEAKRAELSLQVELK